MPRVIWCAVLVVFFSSLLFGQSNEPIRFRGAYIGESLSDFADCAAKKPTSLRDGFKIHGHPCEGRKGVIAQMHIHAFNSKEEGTMFMFDNRLLFKIVVMIPNNDWEKVKYDLSQKMGEPQAEVPDVYQNGFGARWEFNQGFWTKGSTVAYAGIQVEHLGAEAIKNPFTGQIDTKGIRITVTDDIHAKLPSTRPSSLD